MKKYFSQIRNDAGNQSKYLNEYLPFILNLILSKT